MKNVKQQSKFLKIRYFHCQKGNDHQDQTLNFICIDKKCNKKGLLCSICKSEEHQNHNVVPLKILLEKLQYHHQKPMQSQNFQDHIGDIENIRNSILYELRLCVQNIAQKFKDVQKKIIDEFAKTKVQLLQQIQLNMKFQAIIQSALNSRLQDQQSFTQDMNRIASLVQANDLSKGLIFQINLTKIVDNYKQLKNNLGFIFEKVQKSAISVLDIAYIEAQDLNLKSSQDFKINTNKNSMLGDLFSQQLSKSGLISQPKLGLKYTFSPNYKGPQIILQKLNKIARQSTNGNQRFVLVNQGHGIKQQAIAFKIDKLKNWIGVGIGIRDNLEKQNYQFNYGNLGHGSYLLSANGFTWSHTQKGDNVVSKNFTFIQGDVIQVYLKTTSLDFKKRKDGSVLSLKISINENEWPYVCFCANLCSVDDTIQILDII